MKTMRHTLGALAAALLLSACTVTVTTPSFGLDLDDVGSSEAYTDLVPRTFTLASGESATLRFDLSSTSRTGAYFVIDQGTLVVEEQDGTPIASSNSGFFFGVGLSGLAAQSEILSRSSVPTSVQTSCVGPCVILDPTMESRTIVVEVTNDFGGIREIDLYAFGQDLDDTTEPTNNDRTGADAVSSTISGAIETVGDVDWYEVTDVLGTSTNVIVDGTFASGVSSDDLITLEAAVYDANGDLVDGTFVGGQNPVQIAPSFSHTFTGVVEGDYVRVRGVDGRAAASEYSSFFIELN